MDGDDVMRLRAADTFIMLGDISLETGTTLHTYPTLHLNLNLIECATAEKFECAITDYTTGLELNIQLFPLSSRQLAEAHYKPGITLDLTAGILADAIHHAQCVLESVEAYLYELRAGRAGTLAPLPEPPASASVTDDGKAKAKANRKLALVPDEQVLNWNKTQIEAEIGELKQDLALRACTPLSTYALTY